MIGARLGRIRIVEKIGEGGMGTVYRGQDEHLGRDVAVKVLRAGALSDESARRRFRREALALSKLNHPNVELIYDFDTQEGVHYLVTEFIPGLTLRDMLSGHALAEKEFLSLGAQMAEGLAAAHDLGIVHCDLKPANLMVTPDGRLKILDFGLAKLIRPEKPRESTSSSTQPHSAGGTLPYMAPEQLSGDPVDCRSDIYTMGNVLYEMATGRLPFQEVLSTALVDEIMHKPPPPPGRFSPNLSLRMEEMILKCLEKDPDNRYLTVREVLVDFRRSSSYGRPGEYVKKREKRRQSISSILLLLVVALLTTFLFIRVWPLRVAKGPPPNVASFQVTGTATCEGQPALSPDGSRIAYSADEGVSLDILVTDVSGGGHLRLTEDPADDQDPAWFPDGSAIAFTSNRGGRKSVWKVGPLGGGATLLLEKAAEPAISPDGSKIAFTRVTPFGAYVLGVAPLNKLAELRILTVPVDGGIDASGPAWSPDSRKICYVDRRELWMVEASGGAPQQLTSDGEDKGEPAWSPDGKRIYFSSYQGGAQAIWRISAAGGVAERVTQGTGPESHPDISRDGRLLAHATIGRTRRLVLLDRNSGQETAFPGLDWWMPTIAPDGSRIVALLARPSLGTLFTQPLVAGKPSGQPARLLDLRGVASHPTFSPDGRWIALYSILKNTREIWIVPFPEGQPLQFTKDSGQNMYPAWSPDATRIAYSSERGGGTHIWIAPIQDGMPAGPACQLTKGEFTAEAPAWSLDGSMVAFRGIRGEQSDVWLIPSDGSLSARQLTSGAGVQRLRWDGRTGDLIVSGRWGEERVVLRSVSTQTGASTPFQPHVDLGGRHSYGFFDISRDSNLLVYSSENVSGHVWLLKSIKPCF